MDSVHLLVRSLKSTGGAGALQTRDYNWMPQVYKKLSSVQRRPKKNICTKIVRNVSDSKNMEDDDLLCESVNGNGLIILNRPKVLNAVTLQMRVSLLKKMKEFDKDHKMIILRGQGDRAFCVGGDVHGMLQDLKLGGGIVRNPNDFFSVYKIILLMQKSLIPYISLMNGLTMGGGLGLAAFSHYRVATETTVCGMPENSVGLYPDVGSSKFLNPLHVTPYPGVGDGATMGRKLGLYVALTGYRIMGSDNLRVGLATHMCQSNQLDQLQQELVDLKDKNSNYRQKIEQILQHYTDTCTESKKPLSLVGNLKEIDECFGGDSMEEIIKRLQRNSSEWAKMTLEKLGQMPPTSLKATLRHFQRCENLELKECLRLDSHNFARLANGPNFMEGVRAMIIDKDRKPRWKPSTLEEVTDVYLDSFFKPFEDDEPQINLHM